MLLWAMLGLIWLVEGRTPLKGTWERKTQSNHDGGLVFFLKPFDPYASLLIDFDCDLSFVYVYSYAASIFSRYTFTSFLHYILFADDSVVVYKIL